MLKKAITDITWPYSVLARGGGGELHCACVPPPFNLIVSWSIKIKFGQVVEFDNFSPKITKTIHKNDVTMKL